METRRTQDELDELEHIAFVNAQQSLNDEMNRKLKSANCRRGYSVDEDDGGDNPWMGLRIRALEESLSDVE